MGTRIAFNTFSDDNLGIVVMSPDGSNELRVAGQVLFDMQQQFPISWSPDGTRVVIARTDQPWFGARFEDLNIDIYTVNVDGTGLTRLTDHPAMDFDPVWSPKVGN